MGPAEELYKDIMSIIAATEQAVIEKSFLSKTGPIELLPINVAKGQQLACKQLSQAIKKLYETKYKPAS